METLNLNSSIEEDKLVLKFEDGKRIDIDISADIDFTGLVEHLTHLLSTEKGIDAQLDEEENPKLKIVLETINGIIESYNTSVKKYIDSKVAVEQEE